MCACKQEFAPKPEWVSAIGNETRAGLCEGQQRQKKVGRITRRQWGRVCEEKMNACLWICELRPGGGRALLCSDLALYQNCGPQDKCSNARDSKATRLSQDLFIYSTKREFGHSLVKWSHLLQMNIMSSFTQPHVFPNLYECLSHCCLHPVKYYAIVCLLKILKLAFVSFFLYQSIVWLLIY